MIEEYKKNLEKINKSVNAIYGRLTFSTIAEVLDGEIDLHSIWMKLSDYHNIIHDLYMKASNWLETLDEDDPKFSDLDIEIGDLNRFTYDKIDAAQELIDLLQDILNKEEEEGIKKYFTDIKPMEI